MVIVCYLATSVDPAKEDGKILTSDFTQRVWGNITIQGRDNYAELLLGMLRMNLFLPVEGWQPGISRPNQDNERGFIFRDVFMFKLAQPADATENRSKMCNFTLLHFLATAELLQQLVL